VDEKERVREIAALWKSKADNDLKTVDQILENDDPVTEAVCFHCQQAAEKYLKMFLVRHMIKPPRTHDVGLIVTECAKIDPSFAELADCAYLTDYAVEARYPDDFFVPAREDMVKADADARRVRDFVLSRLEQ
jgi:HEPN domain-containing protein